jgi:Trk K+ transport system NAD-binding subunit
VRGPVSTFSDRRGHVIVCGLNALGLRIVEVLKGSDIEVVVIDDDPERRLLPILDRWDVPFIPETPRLPEVLVNAGVQGSRAVVSVEADDLRNLETALVVHNLRPDVRIIVQIANTAVGAAVTGLVTHGAALDVASLAAPSLVQACLGGGHLELDIGGERFALSDTVVTRPGTIRSIFGDLVPIAVIHQTGDPVICPGRDYHVDPGDRVSVLGTGADLAEALGGMRARMADAPVKSRRTSMMLQAMGSVAQGAGRRVGLLIAAIVSLVVVSTAVLRLAYQTGTGHLSVLDSLYFTVETLSTVGYGDFSFAAQSPGLRVFAIVLIILGVTAITALFALITDLLFSRRVVEAFGLRRVTRMRNHVVVVGLGAVGMRVVEELQRYGLPVVVVERDDQNRHLAQSRALGISVITGDATQITTIEAANITSASAVAVLTSNDLTNLETGLSLREHMQRTGREIPLIMRIFDRQLGRVIQESFGFHLVRSTSALAAPWFVGAALGLDILSTFYIDRELLLVARLTVAPTGGLAGMAMQNLSARIRVIGIRRTHTTALEHPPRRATRFAPGDQAYLIGPYEELLTILQRDALGSRSAADASPPTTGATTTSTRTP